MWGIVIGGIVASIIGGIAAYQWGEAKKIEAAAKGAGEAKFWDELEGWLPWVLVVLIVVLTVAASYLILRRWGA